jgi:hypothetical protein
MLLSDAFFMPAQMGRGAEKSSKRLPVGIVTGSPGEFLDWTDSG